MVKKNVFVLLGKNPHFKKIQREKIKSSLLRYYPNLTFITLFSRELKLDALQREIENISFTKRVLIFKNSQNLADDIKKYLLKEIKKIQSNFFIFDFDIESSLRSKLQDDTFFAALFKISPPFKIAGTGKDFSLRDLAFALKRNATLEALLIMSHLFRSHSKEKISMQTLGLIVKLFADYKDPQLRKEYLNYIFESDRLIKEGVISSRVALELLILKLAQPRKELKTREK